MSMVSIRIKPLNQNQALGQIKHDIRLKQPNYLRSKEKDNFVFFDGNEVLQNNDDNEKINQLFTILKEKNNNSRQEHIKISEAQTKRKFQKTTKSVISGIITFSKTMQEDFKNNKELFFQNMQDTLKDIETTLKTKVLYSVLHLDEKTPHIHFMLENFDRKNGKTIQRNIDKNALSNLQDLVGKKWGNMDYNRGIKKEITKKSYYSVLVGHKKEIEEIENNLKKEIELLKEKRKEITNLDLDINAKKIEYKKISEEQEILRKELKEIRETKAKLGEQIKNDTSKIIENSQGVFSIDKEKLNKEIKKVLIKYSKVKTQILDLDILKSEVKNKDLEIEKLKNEVKNKELELIKEYEENNDLNDKLDKFIIVKNLQNKNIETLENSLNEANFKIQQQESKITKLEKENLELLKYKPIEKMDLDELIDNIDNIKQVKLEVIKPFRQ